MGLERPLPDPDQRLLTMPLHSDPAKTERRIRRLWSRPSSLPRAKAFAPGSEVRCSPGDRPAVRYDGPMTPETAHLAGRPVDVLTFNHPSAPGHSGWWGRSPNSKYLKLAVEPTIVRWRERVRAEAG